MELAEVAAYKQFSDVHALVLRKSVGKTAKDIPYADFTLQHDQVSLSCKKWNYDVAKYDHILKEGAVVKVSGSGDLYRGSLQGTIVTIEPSDRPAIDFAKKSRFNLTALYQNLLDVAKSLEDPMLSYVSLTLLTQYKEDFCRAPAASGMHHAWYGGLLEHTHSLISLAKGVIEYYEDMYGTKYFSRARVLCGVLLHDFCKIFEYDSSTPAFRPNPEGYLANHIVKGPILTYNLATKWYNEAIESGSITIEEYPQEKFLRERDILIHMIASHHGTQEWGSPVSPACIEAVLVHHIDNLDSKFMHVVGMIDSGELGDVTGFTKRSFAEKVPYLIPYER